MSNNGNRAETEPSVMVLDFGEFAIMIVENEPENQVRNICSSCLGQDFCWNLKGSEPFAEVCNAHLPTAIIGK